MIDHVAYALQTARQVGPIHPPEAHAHHLGRAKKLHTGPLHSSVAGRTDHLPSNVPNGAYVIPADIVSGLGEGNTSAGFKVAKRMFEGAHRHFGGLPYAGGNGPYGQSGGPYGMAKGGRAGPLAGKSREELEGMDTDTLDRAAWGHAQGDRLNIHPKHIKIKYPDDLANPEAKFRKGGMNWARSVDFSEPASVSIDRQGQYNLEDGHHRWYAASKLGRTLPSEITKIEGNPINKILGSNPGVSNGMASGGEVDDSVPVAVAGGEHVLAPHEVVFAGMGDMDAGHRALDDFIIRQRAKLVKTLKGLPGPKRGDD